jgi:2-dehydro-3-deoxy-D-arabinonate dehydratase
MTCSISRGGAAIFSGSVSTGKLHRKFETLVEYLLRSNAVPVASVLLTGTGIIVTHEHRLAPGDQVDVAVAEIGTLSNPAIAV